MVFLFILLAVGVIFGAIGAAIGAAVGGGIAVVIGVVTGLNLWVAGSTIVIAKGGRLFWMSAPSYREPPEVTRYLNIWFTDRRNDNSLIERKQALVKRQNVYLRLQIAPYEKNTLLTEARPFPSQDDIERAHPEVKGKPIPLEITVFSNDFEVPEAKRTQKMTLKRGQPTKVIYFQVKPIRLGISYLRICVFYRNHMLQSLMVSAPVAEEVGPTSEHQQAHVEMTFSADFAEVGQLPARGLWLGINRTADDSHTLHLKDSKKFLSRNLSERIENALTQAHGALLEVSFFLNEKGEKVSRFSSDNWPVDKDNSPLSGNEVEERFQKDLTKLASVGSTLYDTVFGTGALPSAEEAEKVKSLVEEMETLLGNEQVIQIVRLKFQDIWPWAIMYDLPVDPDNVREACLGFRGADGHAVPFADCVKSCKHPDIRARRHRNRTVVCPYGFWGFKHIIEQPARHTREKVFQNLTFNIEAGTNPVLEMPVEKELIQKTPEHWKKMRDMAFKRLDSLAEIEDAFVDSPEPHVAYFFCHGAYDANKNPYLVVGDNERVSPRDFDAWNFSWPNSQALVFINGRHTADLLPKDLSSIMAPFVDAGAAGIIGTEVSVTTYLASEFAEGFFKHLLPNGEIGQPVGKIIKNLRLQLLMKYNPLGLVYTPFCSADLRVVR